MGAQDSVPTTASSKTPGVGDVNGLKMDSGWVWNAGNSGSGRQLLGFGD